MKAIAWAGALATALAAGGCAVDRDPADAQVQTRDLQENVLSRGVSPLEGRRIQVQPYE